ncbi:tumor necrosis factor receptor superfamily member 5-like isoform X2 [Sinocyclocheilus grahami]|uniref:tumor necrosis factor receptor superfamily member 5-like isoform X2 n=1 Tax=Sinocyclocheilus grahami TaxID=75366 RepID=UPI0007ACF319|nr:PREDICTED: tumor necrosis factor receptor superfamily member 5-like isoform X2 [Sinocyclocheilus grahami]
MFALRIIILITLIVPLNYKLCSCQCARAEYEIHKQCCPMCAPDRGLRVNKVCTRSSDTVCGPLERFYCIEKKKDCCTLAVQHSECSPGQYIKQAGTGATDNVCADCTGDTYSNGSFSSCLQHTICEALGLTETNPGTHSSDTKCGNPSTVVARITPSVIVTLILIPVIIVFIFKHIRKKKQSKSSGIQETGNGLHENESLKGK